MMKKRVLGQYKLKKFDGTSWDTELISSISEATSPIETLKFQEISRINWQLWSESEAQKFLLYLHEFAVCEEEC